MKILYLKNFRKGFATNSSSTHSIIYKNKEDIFEDLNIFDLDYYDRYDNTIAATREAKIKYVTACVFQQVDLMKRLADRYGNEITQYYPKIKERLENNEWDIFGEYSRGSINSGGKNVLFDYDMCVNIIEDENIVIVGGSDEADFVFETIEGHDVIYIPYNIAECIKNGNYYIVYSQNYSDNLTKTRLCVDKTDIPIPVYPELIDLKITDKCSHNCSFCYQGSTSDGKHADLAYLKRIIGYLMIKTEFSIGGGNILEYPDLDELFSYIKKNGHILNITLNAKDIVRIKSNSRFNNIINQYVDGIGVSLNSIDDIKNWVKFNELFPKKYITCHMIPELLGLEESLDMIRELKKLHAKNILNILFLGFKDTGRGENAKVHKFDENDIRKLMASFYKIGVDTSFLNKFSSYIKKNYIEETFTYNEGEYSMYIDGIKQCAYKSSYNLETPYDLTDMYYNNINKIFEKIRKDGGFPSIKKYYE